MEQIINSDKPVATDELKIFFDILNRLSLSKLETAFQQPTTAFHERFELAHQVLQIVGRVDNSNKTMLLLTLYEHQRLRPREFQSLVVWPSEVSSRTIRRYLKTLVQQQLITKDGEEYTLSETGRALFEGIFEGERLLQDD